MLRPPQARCRPEPTAGVGVGAAPPSGGHQAPQRRVRPPSGPQRVTEPRVGVPAQTPAEASYPGSPL